MMEVCYHGEEVTGLAEPRYVSQAERARRLIDKGVSAWQQVQTFAMAHDEWVDSAVLRGQELWLPHHETDGRQFRVALVVGLHFPQAATAEGRAAVDAFLRTLEEQLLDADGSLSIRAETA